jgi:hypothetical protein
MAHALIVVLVFQTFPKTRPIFEPRAISVELVAPAPPPPPPEPPPPTPEPSKPPPKISQVRKPDPPKPAARPFHLVVRPPTPRSLPTPPPSPPVPAPTELSASEVTGALTAGAGSGSGGTGAGACDMVRRLQEALRRDSRVQAAAAEAHRANGGRGAAILVWNGDWLRSGAQDGKGLAGVRQAISVGVAFAPEACRAQPVNGLVLISLNDTPGSARLALGARRWRWSDLLFAR